MRIRFIVFLLICLSFFYSCSSKTIALPKATNKNSMISDSYESTSVPETKDLQIHDFSVLSSTFEVQLFGDINSVFEKMGNKSSSIIFNNTDAPDFSILGHKWGSLYLEWIKGNGTIIHIIVDGNDYQTKSGIQIGDNIERIEKIYGNQWTIKNDTKIEFDLGNEEFESMMALVFYLDRGFVTRIEITQGT